MENNILIIDDDKDLCILLRDSLLKEDIYADISFNGFDGIKAIKEKEYQLVVLDVMLPGISGFEILEKIRNASNVPILMLTAKDDSISKVKGLRLGADDYLTKPFEMEEFFARVLSLIRRYTRLNNIASKSVLSIGDLEIDLESGIVELLGKEVELSGWIQKIRNLGGMVFIDLRDQFGITQIVISDEELQKQAKELSTESCIHISGKVVERSNKNSKIPFPLSVINQTKSLDHF